MYHLILLVIRLLRTEWRMYSKRLHVTLYHMVFVTLIFIHRGWAGFSRDPTAATCTIGGLQSLEFGCGPWYRQVCLACLLQTRGLSSNMCKEYIIITQVILLAVVSATVRYNNNLLSLHRLCLVSKLLETPELLLAAVILLFLVHHQVRADTLCGTELVPAGGDLPGALCAHQQGVEFQLTSKQWGEVVYLKMTIEFSLDRLLRVRFLDRLQGLHLAD